MGRCPLSDPILKCGHEQRSTRRAAGCRAAAECWENGPRANSDEPPFSRGWRLPPGSGGTVHSWGHHQMTLPSDK